MDMTAAVTVASRKARLVVIHSATVRLTHWLNAAAMTIMMMSGWGIYNASPLFGFRFPVWATLGGWLGGSIAWHLAGIWLLVGNWLVYIGYGLATRHFHRRLFPLSAAMVWGDFCAACTLRLAHRLGTYNALQRLFYLAVLLLTALAVTSGLVLWKPVQLDGLARLIGGYEFARRLHFFAMAGLAGFVVLHVALSVLLPRTLVAMITGRARVPEALL